jgi:hypothetical protein
MSTAQRVTLIAAGLIALGLGIISFILPDELRFDFGLAEIEIYKRPAPLWLSVTVVYGLVLLLVCLSKYRKPN